MWHLHLSSSEPCKGQRLNVKVAVSCACLFQVGADNVRSLYKRTLELHIDYKRLLIKKTIPELENLEHEKKVIK